MTVIFFIIFSHFISIYTAALPHKWKSHSLKSLLLTFLFISIENHGAPFNIPLKLIINDFITVKKERKNKKLEEESERREQPTYECKAMIILILILFIIFKPLF